MTVLKSRVDCVDLEGKTLIFEGEPLVHTLSDVTEAPASCTVDGVKAHKHCSVCGKDFINDVEVSADDMKISALGHDFGAYSYIWADDKSSCKAVRTCTRCTESETVVGTVTSVTSDATCTEKGSTVYTAKFTGEGLANQTETVEIPAKGHAFGAYSYIWADDKSSCKAVRTCTRCTESETVVGTVTSVTSDATCTEKGSTVYTAKFTGEGLANQTETVEIPAKGHTIVEDAAIPATKAETGLTAGTHCSVCGTTIKAQTVIAKLPSEATKSEVKTVGTSAVVDNTAVRSVIDEGLALEVKSEEVAVEMPHEVLSAVIGTSSDNVKITAVKLDESMISVLPDDVVKNAAAVISLNLTVGGTPVHQLGGNVRVSVDYALGDDQDSDRMYVAYVTDKGIVEKMDAEYRDGKVFFETNHFSYYAVYFDEESSSGFTVPLILGLFVGILVAAAAAVIGWKIREYA